MPILVADNWSALGGTVADGVGEFYTLEEMLYLLIESCSADDDLIELSAEGLEYLLADHLAYLLRDDRHLQ